MMPVVTVPPGTTATALAEPDAVGVGVPAPPVPFLEHAARNPASDADIPKTVIRRMNSRRPILPAKSSSMTWFSTSVRVRRISSTRSGMRSMRPSPFVPRMEPRARLTRSGTHKPIGDSADVRTARR
jgi:hypothetical protein